MGRGARVSPRRAPFRGIGREGGPGSTPRGGDRPRCACSARSSPRSAWPSISCTLRRSAPPSSRWVANEWRRRCGCTRVGSSPASASLRRIRNAPARVSAPPRALRNRSGRYRRSRCGPPEREVAAHRLGRGPAERDDALLVALAEHPDDAPVEVDRGLRRARLPRETRSPAPYRSSTSARSRSARASSRSPPRSGARTRRGRACAAASRAPRRATSAAGLSARSPRGPGGGRYARTAAIRRAIVDGAPAARIVATQASSSSVVAVSTGCRRGTRAKRREVAPVRVDRARRAPRREEEEEALDLGVGGGRSWAGPDSAGRRRLLRGGGYERGCAWSYTLRSRRASTWL